MRKDQAGRPAGMAAHENLRHQTAIGAAHHVRLANAFLIQDTGHAITSPAIVSIAG
jgi:hypothetical protein